MSQGLLPYTVEVVERTDTVTGRAGLPLVLETMRALGLEQAIAQHVHVRERQSGYTETEKSEALVLLLAAGGDCLDDIAVLQADAGLGRLVGRRFPSADTLRHFLYACHDDALIAQAQAARPAGQVAYIPAENAALQGLAHVNTALVHRVAAEGHNPTATLDHDATIQESHKREALPHYQGGRGYQPAAVYWVEQDLVVADEYRDGNVGAGMENLPLIRRAFASLPPAVTTRFFRADSACYDERVLKWLADPARPGGPAGPIGFTISADMTEALHAVCAAVPARAWALVEERADETVHCAEVEFFPGDWPKLAEPLRYVALRIRKRQGQLFATGADTKYLAIVSNRWEVPAADLLRWHWQKAGTIELVHDITKNELGAAVPPCGRFGANAAWYRLSLLTYNVLSALKSLALPSSLSAARPKRLRFTVFTLAGRLVSKAGRLRVRISAAAERLAGLIAARRHLVLLAQGLPAG
ncbi:MAG: IS1380 family transposase [Planctomycetes bacterium]|nr:IS1380 family transposase [Planctomycetota bacterium]